MLLQKVDDRIYVQNKIETMYKQANISIPVNRLGLAKGIGLVCRNTSCLIFGNANFQLSLFFDFLAGSSFASGYCTGKT